MKGLLGYLVKNGLLVNLVSIFLVLLGLFAMFSINREAFPNVNLDLIQIDMRYPGATPEEVERLVITPIEQELKALNGIDKMTSVAYPGSGRISLELDPHSTNRARMVSDVQLAVDRANLPNDLPSDPSVLEIDGAVFSIIDLAISAPLPPLELKRLGDRIKDDLLEIPGVARVLIRGKRKAEIRITVNPQKLQHEHIGVGTIADQLKAWNINAPGGDINTPTGQKGVRIVDEFRSAQDATNLILRANERGQNLRLGDVATITEDLEKSRVIYDVAGEPGLSLTIMKKSDADIIATVDRVKDYIKIVPKKYGSAVKVDTYQDFSHFARLRLGVLTNNGLVGIVLVFISLILFLRPSVALTTTWGLPVVFFTGLYVLFLSGVTLNLISMMGFIIVLGMLVDDAIIIGENITYHMEKGMAPVAAAIQGTYELIGPVTATIMTTIVAFLPLMFMSGMIGKFIVAIPVVVITLLFFSWLEAFLILPSHVAHVTNPHKHPPERTWILKLENTYGRLLEKALKHRYLTFFLAIVVFIGSIVLAATSMSFQLFPPVAIDQYIVRVTAQPGTNLETMRNHLVKIDKEIRKQIPTQYIETTLLASGEIAVDEGDPLTQRGSRFGHIRVIYTPAVTRPKHDALMDMHAIARTLPAAFPELDLGFTELRPGPPTGRPLEVEISGHDNAAMDKVARRLLTYLKTIPGVTSVDSGLKPGDDELHVVVDRKLATYAGVDLSVTARHVRAAVGGLVVSTLRRGTEEVDITIRYPENSNNELQQLNGLLIPNRSGGLVPLQRIARLEASPGYTTIRHRGGIRVVSVVADINTDVITSREINSLVADHEKDWAADDASRVQVRYGGEEEKNQESFRGLMISFLFALVGIFFILAIQFNKLSYPLIVMLSIPFGIVGIIISFFLHDLFWKPMPLSFFSTMGMVALSGVVVNSALVLLVFIQRAMAEGTDYLTAIMLAGRRRLRAVLLTAATTVMGLLPTAYGWGGMDPFVSPMALALAWGLVFATLITLLVIPAILAVSMDIKQHVREKFKRPSPLRKR